MDANAGRPQPVAIKETHLAYELAWATECYKALIGSVQRFNDGDRAIKHDVKPIAILSFAKQHGLRRVLRLMQRRRQCLDLRRRKFREERYAPDQARHRHTLFAASGRRFKRIDRALEMMMNL